MAEDVGLGCARTLPNQRPQHYCLPPPVLLRRSVRLCWLPPLLGPTSSSCIDDGRATTLPLLLSSAMRAPFRCPFMHAQLHHPPCATALRTKGSHGPTHAMQHSAGPQASQHGGLRASLRREEGRGVFTYSTVRLTREWASLARDGEPESKILVASRVLVNQIHLNPAAGRLAGWQDGKVR